MVSKMSLRAHIDNGEMPRVGRSWVDMHVNHVFGGRKHRDRDPGSSQKIQIPPRKASTTTLKTLSKPNLLMTESVVAPLI